MFTNIKNNNRITILILLATIILAGFLRFYKLGEIPPSISWDEAAVGYNSWTITHYGKDEWGKFLPIVFKSFEDDKHPVHIYLTAISVGILGLSDFSVRFPAAIFGILNVILLFFLGKQLFKNNLTGLLAVLFLAISPYNLHFSRFNHELNFTIFFFMLGLLLFFRGLERRKNLLLFVSLSFGITLLSYHSAKIVVPPIIFLLVLLYFKDLLKIKKQFLISVLIFIFFTGLMILNPALLGIARAKQTALSKNDLAKTQIYQMTQNEILGSLEIVGKQYLMHFSPQYLFISGDKNPRLSSQSTGEFYKIEALFLIIGFLSLLWMRSKISVIILFWALFAPIPASLVNEAPHAARAMFMTGSWHLISAFGLFTLINFLKKPRVQITALIAVIGILSYELQGYLRYYYGEYSKRYAIEWQYGMKQAVEYLKDHNGYFQVWVTDARSEPYIFFLYSLKYPLERYLENTKFNHTQSRSYNLVSAFNKYHFGGWSVVESQPIPGVLYMIIPTEYDGLKYKHMFDIKKKIVYPNGTDAFFLVSYP